MYIEFDKEYLKELYETGASSSKKHRFQPEVVRGYIKCVRYLLNAERIEDLYRFNSLHYEVLVGDKAGISSLRINQKYSLEFTVREISETRIIRVCNLLDISNHYK